MNLALPLIVRELFLWFILYSSSHSSSQQCHQSPWFKYIFSKLLFSSVLIFARDVLYTSALMFMLIYLIAT